jgi:hypothetical protein
VIEFFCRMSVEREDTVAKIEDDVIPIHVRQRAMYQASGLVEAHPVYSEALREIDSAVDRFAASLWAPLIPQHPLKATHLLPANGGPTSGTC